MSNNRVCLNMAKVYDLQGKAAGEVKLPRLFSTPFRPDVIQRAVLAIQSQNRQPYGSDILAGKRTSAHYHGKRHIDSRQQMMNKEMARLPRVHGKSAGWQAWRARMAPQVMGGRRAHPPKAEKQWALKVNKREHKLAVRSALAASMNPELVKERGHKSAAELPMIIVDDFENVNKSRDVLALIEKVGLGTEINRCKKRKVRAGRGTMRGRKYKTKKGLLVITSKQCPVIKAAAGLPGVDAVPVEGLNAELLAPGCQAGRITIITKPALEALTKVW